VVRDGEIVFLGGVILGTREFVPLTGFYVIAHPHVDNARFKGAAYGVAAIYRVGGGIESVACYAEVGSRFVLYGVVELNGNVSAKGSQMNEFTVL
jgi:hypothetical protein